MKTIKYLTIAALALLTFACSNEDNDLQQPANTESITITAKLAPKSTATRAVVDNSDGKITATWAENEKIAILYEVSSVKKVAVANIDNVDGTTGEATISFSVDGGTADNTLCTLVYPATAAKDDNSGVKAFSDLLSAQDGTLNANLDVRVGAGKIQVTTPSLDVTTQPAAQFAIFKFTIKKTDESTLNVTSLAISAGGEDLMITPATSKNVLYVALPAISGETVSFIASGSDIKTYTWSKPSVSFSEGYFYQSTLKLSEQTLIGDGTAGDPYLAYSKADWDAIATIVNDGTNTSANIKQMANISGITTVMGTASHPFKGVYDGQGYTISNVDLSGSTNVGLFGYVNGASAVIKNVVIASGTISSTSTDVGSIVGRLYTGTVQYCANFANVSSSYSGVSNCGGIVGHMDSNGETKNVTYCINFGDVTAYNYAGGIVGSFAEGNVTYCQNYGTIRTTSTSNRICGGIVGFKSKTSSNMMNNHNGGDVSRAQSGEYYQIIKGSSSDDVDASNTYWTSMTLTSGPIHFTGDDLASYRCGATAIDTNPAGITIGSSYYAGPGAP